MTDFGVNIGRVSYRAWKLMLTPARLKSLSLGTFDARPVQRPTRTSLRFLRRPTSELEGAATAIYNFNMRGIEASGHVSGPISDTLSDTIVNPICSAPFSEAAIGDSPSSM